MNNKLISEEQLLDEAFRVRIIKEIQGQENIDRKNFALRAHEIYQDQTKKWVIESLNKEKLKPETVQRMENRAANISICRKVVNKLAQTFVGGVMREPEVEADKESVEMLARLMQLDTKEKKWDRYLELFKNTLMRILPELDTVESLPNKPKFKLKMQPLPPYMYDVIPDMSDPEKMRAVVLTDFTERNQSPMLAVVNGGTGRETQGIVPQYSRGDGKEQTIAGSRDDAGQEHRTFIWWSDKYHFTTDNKGKIIAVLSPDDLLNPIQKLPFVNNCDDQDGSFWAAGGEDLVEGSILINLLITDMFSIANVQGWGQMVITGKKIPKVVEGGPHNAIVMEYAEGEPEPKIQFATSNPPLETWMRMIEQYVALLLTTNNLSPGQISGKLDAANFPSGIANLIEQSESTASVEDKHRIFQDKEPMIWDIVIAWHKKLLESDSLCDDFKEVKTPSNPKVSLKFVKKKQVITEKERLEILKLRKELGLDSMIDLIKADNPDLTDEEAEKKLLRILKERLEQAAAMGLPKPGEKPEGEEDPNAEPKSGEKKPPFPVEKEPPGAGTDDDK